MPSGSVPPNLGPGATPPGEDWMTEADLEAWLDVQAAEGPPPDLDLSDTDPYDSAPPYDFDMEAIRSECRRIATEQVVAAEHIAQLGYTAVLAEAAAARASRARRTGFPASTADRPAGSPPVICWISPPVARR